MGLFLKMTVYFVLRYRMKISGLVFWPSTRTVSKNWAQFLPKLNQISTRYFRSESRLCARIFYKKTPR